MSWDMNEDMPEGWKPELIINNEEENKMTTKQQSKKPKIMTSNNKVDFRVKLKKIEQKKVEFLFREV